VNLLEVVRQGVDDVAVFVTELDLSEHGHTFLLDRHSGRLYTRTTACRTAQLINVRLAKCYENVVEANTDTGGL